MGRYLSIILTIGVVIAVVPIDSALAYQWVVEEWVDVYEGPGNDWDLAEAIAIDDSNNVYVTGCSWGDGTNLDYATVKYDPNGDELWEHGFDKVPQGTPMTYVHQGHHYVAVAIGGSRQPAELVALADHGA